jgi:hypothetical protein
MTREYDLISKGYGLRGISRKARIDIEVAKEEAKALRERGFYAQIISCRDGHFIFTKKK